MKKNIAAEITVGTRMINKIAIAGCSLSMPLSSKMKERAKPARKMVPVVINNARYLLRRFIICRLSFSSFHLIILV